MAANPDVWAKTVFIVVWDEHGGPARPCPALNPAGRHSRRDRDLDLSDWNPGERPSYRARFPAAVYASHSRAPV
ncbi:alkaline phosphatase family protein [Actinopolymorpha pittospori]|uniref:alkaline phosphatase family protein n=1 Tax=Actinopolymorpha pittospori TaxID=648752 RepID=UPI003B5865B3